MTSANEFCGSHERHPECLEVTSCPELTAIDGQKTLVLSGNTSNVDYPHLRLLDESYPPDILHQALLQTGAIEGGTIQERTFFAHLKEAEEYYDKELVRNDGSPNIDQEQNLFLATKAYNDAPIFEILTELKQQFRERGKQLAASKVHKAGVLARVVLLEELGH